MDIAEVLSGHAGLSGVQWTLLGPSLRRLLRRELGALLPAPEMLEGCHLRRAKFKPGRKLSAYYEIRVRGQDAGERSPRPIAVTWTLPGDADPRGAAPKLADMQAEAVHRGLAAPFGRLVAEVPTWGMRLQVSPLDARFPQLIRVSDPRHVSDLLAAACATDEDVAPREAAAHYAVTPIRYRPGQRHVLRYDLVGANGHSGTRATVFAKLYAGEEGASSFQVATGIADWLAACGSSLTAARPRAYLAAERVVLYPGVIGIPLPACLWRPGAAKHLRAAGAGLVALHRAPGPLTSQVKPRDFAAEVAEIGRASAHVPALLPAAGARIARILERALELHARLPLEQPAFAHGDFKADHLWVSPAGLVLLDFDTCCLADPALDVGKFLADLHWWYTARRRPGLERAQDEFLQGYAQAQPERDARLARARLYEAVLLVKLAARRVRLFDTDWAPRTAHLIGCAEAALAALEARLARPAAGVATLALMRSP
jgi:hypothetical protein